MPLDIERTSYLAFDPGGSTGWAVHGPGLPYAGFYASELHGTFEEQAQVMADLFYKYNPAVVVYESYTITQRTAQLSQQHEPLMLIGLIRWFASRNHIQAISQKPAQAKSFATDKRLKALDWYASTPGGHANDAARHLVTWLASNNKFDQDTLKTLAAV